MRLYTTDQTVDYRLQTIDHRLYTVDCKLQTIDQVYTSSIKIDEITTTTTIQQTRIQRR